MAEQAFKSIVADCAGNLITKMYQDGAGFVFLTEKLLGESKISKMMEVLGLKLKEYFEIC
jgi:hypothetical protein